jgi:hypothetical protein
MYDKTITILNKLKKADTGLSDVWVKTVITNVEYVTKSNTTINGNVVSMGESVTILIPFGNGYIPYRDWKSDTSKGYTISQGDVVFLDMNLTETVTSENITSIKKQYEQNVCDVRVFRAIEDGKRSGYERVQVKIEGV